MEFPAHIVFSCLLVCQPAIFVDSKRDGTGAAHGRRDFKMATLDVTEERRRAIDRVNRAYADEDYDR